MLGFAYLQSAYTARILLTYIRCWLFVGSVVTPHASDGLTDTSVKPHVTCASDTDFEAAEFAVSFPQNAIKLSNFCLALCTLLCVSGPISNEREQLNNVVCM